MSLSLEQKKALVSEVAESIGKSSAGVLAEYRGMSVQQMTSLRRAAHAEGVWIKVVKNNLARRAVKDSEFECLTDYFVGPVLLSLSEDPVSLAKVIAKFEKENEEFKLSAGVMSGSLIDRKTILRLSQTPSREELLAKLVGGMKAPSAKLVSTLNEIPARLVRTLAAVAASREQAS
ncbi:MAG: 50S ribosomal protein L10 [Gammaproteobacteria bacterium]|nr:50S ribosomal protein L10 [Gammaproteobacteria bacterium]MCY4226894.1 50S ribosomal protein L10 [Gammaproteobacteria bacterium]MCY4312450.1 50S ribosomal protein L10 [Gammaproteobacteria bacterium]